MSKFSDEAADYDLIYQHQTDAAWAFKGEDGELLWLPKSQVEADIGGAPVRGKVYTVTVPNWIAEREGLC